MNNKIRRASAPPEFDDGLFNRLAAEVFAMDADAVNAQLAELGLNTFENQARLSHWLEVRSPGGRGRRPQGSPPCSNMAAAAPQARKNEAIGNTLIKHCAHSGFNAGVLRSNSKQRAAVPSKPGGFGRAKAGTGLRPEPLIGPSSSSNLDMGLAMSLISDAGLARPVKP